MSATIQFTTDTFRPICIKGNDDDADPVEFELQAVGGPGRARLKSILLATSGLQEDNEWSPAIQDSVIRAFETGAPVFQEAVVAIRGLRAPVALLLKVGILRTMPPGADANTEIPVTSGVEFARLAGYWPMLATEVALRLAIICRQAEINPRFFTWLARSAGIAAIPPGTAAPAARTRASKGTAGSKTRKGANRRTT